MKKLITFTLVSFMFVSTIISDEITDAQTLEMSKLLSIDDVMRFQRISHKILNSGQPNFSIEIRSNELCLKDHDTNEEICLSKAVIANYLLEQFKKNNAEIIAQAESACYLMKKQDLPDAKFSIHNTNKSIHFDAKVKEVSVNCDIKEKNPKLLGILSGYWGNHFTFTVKGSANMHTDRLESFNAQFENLDPETDQN